MKYILAMIAIAGMMIFGVSTVEAARPHHRGHISFGNHHGIHIDLHRGGLYVNPGHRYYRPSYRHYRYVPSYRYNHYRHNNYKHNNYRHNNYRHNNYRHNNYRHNNYRHHR